MANRVEITFGLSLANMPAKKIFKVISYGKGGFAVLLPYHEAKEGVLAKSPLDYSTPGMNLYRINEMVAFSASDNVKMSYHSNGFVHFSRAGKTKIRSGQDEKGEFKGLGVKTRPLRSPITSGATFGVMCWGLDKFTTLAAVDDTCQIFDEREIVWHCEPHRANAWYLETYVILKSRVRPFIDERGHRVISGTSRNGFGIMQPTTGRVTDLPNLTPSRFQYQS
jgi:hypothetical protein